MADLQHHSGAPIGFANPLLYWLPAGAFHDVVHVANAGVVRSNFVNGVDASDGYAYIFRSFDFTTGLTIHTVPGYDNVTGRGTVHGAIVFQ